MKRSEIVSESLSWVNTPWRHQGRIKHEGVDCIGLCVGVAQTFGVVVEDDTSYGRRPRQRGLEKALRAHCTESNAPRLGGIVLFSFLHAPEHVGINCGSHFVHGYAGLRKIVAQQWNDKWRNRVIRYYDLPGVVDG